MKRLGIGTVLKNAFSVLFQNFGIALLIAVLCGGLGAAFMTKGVEWAVYYSGVHDKQQLLYVTQFGQLILLTIWGCIVGAWAAPAGIYLWVQREKGQVATAYDAVNYGLNRFGRVLSAHARAFLVIQIGMIVIVPGILFGLQYAFVDAIATLDTKEDSPLSRSRRLTSGRRGTIFRTFLVFTVWWLPFQLMGIYVMQGAPVLAQVLGGTIDHLVLLVIDLCMVQYYLDLFRNRTPDAAPRSEGLPQGSVAVVTGGASSAPAEGA